MARYKPIDMVEHYRGKICMHSDTFRQWLFQQELEAYDSADAE